jgi:hypothetical protein
MSVASIIARGNGGFGAGTREETDDQEDRLLEFQKQLFQILANNLHCIHVLVYLLQVSNRG